MEKFLKCFDKSKSANLTVYAEKTTTSSSGHAFIEITQGNNTMIFGFYPKNSFPSNISGPGIMGENGGHYYNGKWNLGNISADKLQQIISLSINYSLSDYGLAYNNCADFTLGILSIVGIANSSNGIDGPNTILDLMPASAKTNSGNAPQSHRTCN